MPKRVEDNMRVHWTNNPGGGYGLCGLAGPNTDDYSRVTCAGCKEVLAERGSKAKWYQVGDFPGRWYYSEALDMEAVCFWEYDEVDDYYQTGCDKAFVLLDGTLDDNEISYCPYCGQRIYSLVEVEDAETS